MRLVDGKTWVVSFASVSPSLVGGLEGHTDFSRLYHETRCLRVAHSGSISLYKGEGISSFPIHQESSCLTLVKRRSILWYKLEESAALYLIVASKGSVSWYRLKESI